MSRALQFEAYSEEYKQIVKAEWYKQGRPSSKKLREFLPPDEHGRIPNWQVLDRFRKNDWWDVWADELDSRVMSVVEDDLVIKRVEMLKRHANDAMQLEGDSLKYLKENGFDSSASAVAAFKVAVEIERVSRGVSEFMAKAAQMDNSAITDEIMKLISRASENNQIIEADIVPAKEETTAEE